MRFPWIKGLLLLAASWATPSQAACTDNTFINPVGDIAWDCIFPISIMGVPLDYGDHPPDKPDSRVICQCPGQGALGIGLGFMVGFWEPARIIETVANAGCFPALGLSLDVGGFGLGSNTDGAISNNHSIKQKRGFAQYHYYIFPVWALLELFQDIPCISGEGQFDLAMISEIRPDWTNDLFALQLFPETALMANPATVLACAADALAATGERTIDALYWCQGAWGTTYPATGSNANPDNVIRNAATAGKAMYLQARTGLLPDRAVNFCNATPLPLWVKSHWRIQQTDPVQDKRCRRIGHPGLLWSAGNNPVGKQDNFAWMLFRKVSCCVTVF